MPLTFGNIFYQQLTRPENRDTLVLVMGYSGNHLSWPQFFLDRLLTKSNLIIFDNRGVGQSFIPKTETDFSMEAMATDVVSIIDTLNLDSVRMLGWSLGGCIALKAASLLKERATHLILVSSTAGGVNYVWPDISLIKNLLNPIGSTPLEMYLNSWRSCLPENDFDRFVPALTEIFEKSFQHPTPYRTSKGQLNAYKNFDAAPFLNQIKAKTLIISGANDRLTPVENSKKLAALLPHATLEIIPDCEHIPHLEQTEKYFKSIEDFLTP